MYATIVYVCNKSLCLQPKSMFATKVYICCLRLFLNLCRRLISGNKNLWYWQSQTVLM